MLADPGGEAAEGSFAALHGLFWTVVDLAEAQPLLLAVDDLQWSDRASLRFLAYLARRIEELPVLLLATVRTGEPDVDEDLLAAVRQPPARVLEPGPLSADAVDELLVERLGPADAAFVDAAYTATGGNPLLVRELAAALEAEGERPVAARAEAVRSVGPRAVSRTVGARLARLDPDAVATARAVAVLGDGVTVADAARFAGLDPERVAAATGPLARAQVLRPEPPLAFVHPLVADAVLQTLPPGERELQHAQGRRRPARRRRRPEVVAGHLLRAPRSGRPVGGRGAAPGRRPSRSSAARRTAPPPAAPRARGAAARGAAARGRSCRARAWPRRCPAAMDAVAAPAGGADAAHRARTSARWPPPRSGAPCCSPGTPRAAARSRCAVAARARRRRTPTCATS